MEHQDQLVRLDRLVLQGMLAPKESQDRKVHRGHLDHKDKKGS